MPTSITFSIAGSGTSSAQPPTSSVRSIGKQATGTLAYMVAILIATTSTSVVLTSMSLTAVVTAGIGMVVGAITSIITMSIVLTPTATATLACAMDGTAATIVHIVLATARHVSRDEAGLALTITV